LGSARTGSRSGWAALAMGILLVLGALALIIPSLVSW
jgi:UPF0716 family protein affecting phage T7 exclusion